MKTKIVYDDLGFGLFFHLFNKQEQDHQQQQQPQTATTATATAQQLAPHSNSWHHSSIQHTVHTSTYPKSRYVDDD